jgi:hypothetical protein
MPEEKTPSPDLEAMNFAIFNTEAKLRRASTFAELLHLLDEFDRQKKGLHVVENGHVIETFSPGDSKLAVIGVRDSYTHFSSEQVKEALLPQSLKAGGVDKIVLGFLHDIDHQMEILESSTPNLSQIQSALLRLGEQDYKIKVRRAGESVEKDPLRLLKDIQKLTDWIQKAGSKGTTEFGRIKLLNQHIHAITNVAYLRLKVYKVLREWILGIDSEPSTDLPNDEEFRRRYKRYLEAIKKAE